MRKELSKMYFKGIAKIIFAIGLSGLVLYFVTRDDAVDEIGIAGIITVCICWGIAVLVCLVNGISTIRNGAKQPKEYMAGSPYSVLQLEEECSHAEKFGALRVGDNHVFVNASDGYYILPLTDILSIRMHHYRTGGLISRTGYYRLYLKSKNLQKTIKVYYVNKWNIRRAMECLHRKNPQIQEE